MASASSSVDTTSPFRSVKEAIATYGEQFLARKLVPAADFQKPDLHRHEIDDGGDYNGGDNDDGGHEGNMDLNGFTEMLKKLENELHETRFELKLLKEKEYETEVALASLNAELHKGMSKVARLEATEASNMSKYVSKSPILGGENVGGEPRFDEERRAKLDARKSMEDRPTLEQVLSFGVCEGYLRNSKKLAKKKPIVPLVTDLFAWKKKSPKAKEKDDLAFLSPLYSSSMYLR